MLPTDPMGLLLQFLGAILGFAGRWWWVVGPVIVGPVLWESWLYYLRIKALLKFKWQLLEIKIPPEVEKTPLAMEQVFAILQSTLFKGSWWKRYVEGRVQEWFSAEMTSFGGELHFYIRTIDQFRNLVEAAIYSQYPQAEIYEVEDYTRNAPQDIPNETHNLFGAEFVLARDDAYPIRTYKDFEFSSEEGRANVDPLAGMTETLTKMKDGEQYWIQIGLLPTDDSWKKKGDEIVSKLMGKPKKVPAPGLGGMLKKEVSDYATGLLQAPFKIPEYEPMPGAKKDALPSLMQHLSTGEKEVIEAVERKISKVGFTVIIRVIYLARREVYYVPTFFGVVGTWRQLGTQNLNMIKWNGATITTGKFPFKKTKEIFKKKWLLYKYRLRYRGEKMAVFNIEELATMFHFPGRYVASPNMPRIQAKKGEPPMGLPTY